MMTEREPEMMDRFDGGEGVSSIAAAMGLSEAYVRQTTRYYTVGPEPLSTYLSARRASDELRDAVLAAGGHRK